jgi:GT2 family glycosyltransferase
MLRQGYVSVTIVTYNSGRFIRRCLESVLEQRYPKTEIIVVDNASTDGTVDILDGFSDRVTVVYNEQNAGFAAAQNRAISLSHTEWVLALNPDVLLMPGFIATLVAAGESDTGVGTICGKLLSMSADFQLPPKPYFDSTGVYFTPTLRHFDRGAGQIDDGQYERCEYVFGATGAAALYRRDMIEDVSIDGEFYDNDFFVYREDADVSWRSQLFGWTCLYVPFAQGYHVRTVTPANRKSLPRSINMHSVKNRFLLRIKNVTAPLYLRHLFTISWRDLVVVLGCLTHEFYSLRAFPAIFRLWTRQRAKRRQIMLQRRVTDDYMERWFSFRPVSYPADSVSKKLLRAHRSLTRR